MSCRSRSPMILALLLPLRVAPPAAAPTRSLQDAAALAAPPGGEAIIDVARAFRTMDRARPV